MSAIEFDRYGTQRTQPAPGAQELGLCPACARGHGYDHVNCAPGAAILRAGPAAIIRSEARPAGVKVIRRPAHRYLIRRLPNWRLTRWLIARANRYLRESGSGWRLVPRNRSPRPGVKYGPYSALANADARAVSIYLRWRRED